MLLRNIFIFVYVVVTIFIFSTLEASVYLWLSFFSNAILLSFITYYHIFLEKTYSPFISTYIVFSYLFFLVAPMSQATTMGAMEVPIYTHKFPFTELSFIKTNALISIFHVIFFLFYIGAKTLIKPKKAVEGIPIRNKHTYQVYLFVILSIIVIAFNFPFLLDEFTRPNWLISDYSVSDLLIRKKVLFVLPLAGIVLGVYYLKTTQLNTSKWLMIVLSIALLVVLLFILKNPLTEKRNALGPIYLLLIFLFYPKLMNSNVKTTFLLFFAMVVVFPAIQFLTHVDYGFSELLSEPSLIFKKNDLNEGYMSLNYDAFINIGVILEVVEKNGLSFGFQALSAFLFFVPRSIWPGKPESSGLVVGEYVIDEYNFYFSNLSNPLISEGYLNFGILGVVIMAIALALTVIYLLTWLNSNNYLKKSIAFYFAMHLIFLLRGDFTNGYSYFIGTLIGLYLFPRAIILFSNFFLYKKIWVSKKE